MENGIPRIKIVQQTDEAWKVMASICVATLFEIMISENRVIIMSADRIDEIRIAMQHGLGGVQMSGPNEIGEITIQAYIADDGSPPN